MIKHIKLYFLFTFLILIGIYFCFSSINKEKNSDVANSQWLAYFKKKQERHKKGIPGNKSMRIAELQEHFNGIRTKFGETGPSYPVNYLTEELNKALANTHGLKSANEDIEWISRGPGNVGGRTRCVVVDNEDPLKLTWFACSATGGIWKTTDGGGTWQNITKDLPYLATTTMVQGITNPDILYIGTGESFSGSIGTSGGGIFKSTDKGVTWVQLSATAGLEDFRYVNRLTIDPDNENVVLAATNTGIFKTTDGGTTWDKKYTASNNVEDIKADTSDFNTIFAGEYSKGILRSTDKGETWDYVNNGIIGKNERFEVAISPTNPNKVYCSVQKTTEDESSVYVSWNKGDTWNLIKNINGDDEIDYLGGQGNYDNAIAVHPYSEDTVFVAGVNMWKIGVNNSLVDGESTVTKFENIDANFMSFVGFNGLYPGLGLGTDQEPIDLTDNDFVSVEIRFGPGVSQKAHRFIVPDEATSGVPASDYTYVDYIDVPFEVWDVTNNKQLMCSFRDQEKDGEFNLYEKTGNAYGLQGREYIFVNAVDYDPNAPSANIAVQGGSSYKVLYFLWATLTNEATWDANNLPESKIVIEYSTPQLREGNVINVSNAYGDDEDRNTYNQSEGKGTTSIPGFHPDHHAINMVPVNNSEERFWIVNGNDGGLGISKDNGYTFEQIKAGYITTQFYGVSKKPYRNEYIGGTQDNGTWQSPAGEEIHSNSQYIFRLGGDGFESVWHTKDTNLVMGSLYNNRIYRSLNGGKTWSSADGGIEEDGPFVTKLTMIPSKPNKVFAVGTNGLWLTDDFGRTNWTTIELGEGWIPSGRSLRSSHSVEYSIANDSVIWAGAALSEDFGWNIFVSKDLGNTFKTIEPSPLVPDLLVTNIATHPTEENTCYLLYSGHGESKIVRTEDLGNTWEDISRFELGESKNGFPDVACFSLMVFPDDTDRIWAGTEIGIFESKDNGASWNILKSDLPYVPIYQMFMQDNQVVAGTYGRGIWTYQYGEVPKRPSGNSPSPDAFSELVNIYPLLANDYLTIELEENIGELSIEFYNISGQLVKSSFLGNAVHFQIDVSMLNEGNYVMRLHSERGEQTRRIIIY